MFRECNHFGTLYIQGLQYVKRVRIRSSSGPYFPVFGLITNRYGVYVRMRESADQKNSQYGHFSRSVT